MKLYLYDHCPYCIRVRTIIGLTAREVELSYLLNNDEETPIRLVGQKLVPILETPEGIFMPESLDIVHYIDNLDSSPILTVAPSAALSPLLAQLNSPITRALVMPRYVKLDLPEFATQSARDYFTKKKQQTVGLFDECLTRTAVLCQQLTPALDELASLIDPDRAYSSRLSLDDIELFPLLRSLSLVNSLVFPKKANDYMHNMAARSNVALYFDQAI